jgi:uncharacterized protein (TIGR02145 family)
MMNTKLLRRLTPLMAAFVVACNINESASDAVTQAPPATGYGTFAPRIVAASGRLTPSDSVYLKVWTSKDSGKNWDSLAYFRKTWNDSSVKVENIPVGLLWRAEIAGVKTGADTVWKGTDSGSISKGLSTQDLNNANKVLVRNLVAKPDTTQLPSGSLTIGSSFILTGTGKIVHNWGSVDPECNGGDSSKTITVDASHTTLKLRSCGDSTTWPSAVVTKKFSVVAKPMLSFSDSLKSDATSHAIRQWDEPIVLVPPTGTNISWSIKLNGTDSLSGTSDSLLIPKAWLSKLPATSTEATVLATVILKDGTDKAVDTANLTWTLQVSVTPSPIVFVTRQLNALKLGWKSTGDAQETHAWVSRDAGTTWLASETSDRSITDSVTWTFSATEGEKDTFKVVAISKLTGRTSDTARISGTALQHPVKPIFSAVNSNSTGLVAVTLSDATSKQENTNWKVFIAKDSASLASSDATIALKGTLSNGAWVGHADSGNTFVAVRATRDGFDSTTIVALHIKDTSGGRPKQVADLKLSLRDSNSLTWSWTAEQGRSYRIFIKNDASFTSADDTSSKGVESDVATLGSYKLVGLESGSKWAIAVVSLKSGTENYASNSDPAFSNLDSTKLPPPKSGFLPSNSNGAKGTLQVSIDSFASPRTQWYVGWSKISASSISNWQQATANPYTHDSLAGMYFVAIKGVRDGIETVSTYLDPITFSFTNSIQPKSPTDVSATSDLSSISLKWTPESSATYRVYWQVMSACPSDLAKASGAFHTDTAKGTWSISEPSGTVLCYAVQALSTPTATGTPQIVTPVSIATKAPSNPVTGLQHTINANSSVDFVWTKPNTAVRYQYSTDNGTHYSDISSANTTKINIPASTATDMPFWIIAYSGDNIASSTSKDVAHIPQKRITFDTSNWNIHYSGSSWSFKHSSESMTDKPSTLKATVNGAPFTYTDADNGFITSLSGLSQSVVLQWVWSNGDTSTTFKRIEDIASPKSNETPWAAAATDHDTIIGWTGRTTNSIVTNWTASTQQHSSLGWTLTNADTGIYDKALDSVRILWTRTNAVTGTDSLWNVISVARTRSESVKYQNGTTGTIKTVRINGKTWMAENLNYDVPNNEYDVCYLNIDGNCNGNGLPYGRSYTISQALGLSNSDCDTLPSTGLSEGATGCKDTDLSKINGTLQGICPTNWHLPTKNEWDTISRFGNEYLLNAGDWNQNSKVSPEIQAITVPYMNFLYMRYASRAADAPNFDNANNNWTFATNSDVRTMYWGVPGQTSAQLHTATGFMLEPNSGAPYTTDNIWYYVPAGTEAGVNYARRIVYPIRCVKD